ncbi:conserved hypothetical protein [Planktothrix sp. PCC 11201]|nr:conserved hypothetical protein [Planktothrix sp. PCC 11201]
MLNSIIEQLKLVKDFRKNRGKRHELWVVLTIVLNIYRSLGFSSIKEGQSWLGNNWEKI